MDPLVIYCTAERHPLTRFLYLEAIYQDSIIVKLCIFLDKIVYTKKSIVVIRILEWYTFSLLINYYVISKY